MITEPILGLMAGIAMAFIPFGAVGAVITMPGINRRPLLVALLAWGLAHALAWVWSQTAGAETVTALELYAEVQAAWGLIAALIVAVWPGR